MDTFLDELFSTRATCTYSVLYLEMSARIATAAITTNTRNHIHTFEYSYSTRACRTMREHHDASNCGCSRRHIKGVPVEPRQIRQMPARTSILPQVFAIFLLLVPFCRMTLYLSRQAQGASARLTCPSNNDALADFKPLRPSGFPDSGD